MGRAHTIGRLVRMPLPRHVRLAKALRSEFDGLDNLAVAGATTNIAGDRLDDVLSRRTVVPLKQSVRRQDHSGRAKAALQPVRFAKCVLKDAEFARSRRNSFDRRNRVAVGLHREHEQERTGSPSSKTVQAPQTPCSHPAWVPTRSRSSLMASRRVLRGSTSMSRARPFTSSDNFIAPAPGLRAVDVRHRPRHHEEEARATATRLRYSADA